MSDVWNDFLDSLGIKNKLIDFATYLGFDEKDITGPIIALEDFARTEVDFDDRKIFIACDTIINDSEIRATYVVTDKEGIVLDLIKFRYEDGKWEEYE